jgi:hypothetical protein
MAHRVNFGAAGDPIATANWSLIVGTLAESAIERRRGRERPPTTASAQTTRSHSDRHDRPAR